MDVWMIVAIGVLQLVQVDALGDSERGGNGFGSSGR